MAAIGVVGFALGLAAQDTLTDTISGFIILFDRPFRVGDRIEVSELNTWGDVVEIGTRTTRIRTLDNRMVIVPNSTIGSNQVVNYTYPDSRYRVQVELGIAYETDLEEVRQVISSAVLSVDAVLKDKPVDVLFLEFGETALQFRVRWWIESYVDTRRVFDKVNSAIYVALEEAGIEVPHTVDVRFEKGDVDKKSQPLPGAEDDPAL
jgi:small-conductance mechanosensitive channel